MQGGGLVGCYRKESKVSWLVVSTCVYVHVYAWSNPAAKGPLDVLTNNLLLFSIACIIGPSGSCYKLFTQPLAWSTAKESCQALGAALVKIDSSVENDFISNNFLTYSPATKYWIGLNDLRNEGQFEWSDESSLSGYTNWLGSNPNNWGGSEDCVSIAWGVHYWGLVDFRNPQWNDENCATRNGYMCEKSA